VDVAAIRAGTVGLEERATFRVGSFAATGLEDGCVSAAMTVDALQYAPSKAAAVTEVARVLRPGGRFVFTAFEVEADRVVGLPVLGDDPIGDYRPVLQAAGFAVDAYEETPGWWTTMKGAYRRVLDAADSLSQEMGPAAMAALGSEMAVTLEVEPYRRRVLAVSTRV
jgi:ubiquinone/menaquinone biosynthesis C-methylase UbiE